jgi:hypothetical protein
MSKPIVTILKELAVGFGEEAIAEACQTYMKQTKKKDKKPRAKSSWQIFVEQVFADMKKNNPSIKYMEALKEASRRKKVQDAIDKLSKMPLLPKSRGTTEGCRTETNSEYPSDTEEEYNINIDAVD